MKDRLLSLDVLRGLTIMLMTIVNNPGDWGNVYAPFLHAEWHGFTPTDLVFPTFLFIVGITTVLATPRKVLDRAVWEKILTRFLRIFSLGLFLNFFSKIRLFGLEGVGLLLVRLLITALVVVALFGQYDRRRQLYVALGIFVLLFVLAFGGFADYQNVRLPGVLQRIAVVYLVVSLLYLTTSVSTQTIVGVVILLAYWAIMTLVPVPGIGVANVEKGTNLAAWVDYLVIPNHLWVTSKTWDPEGILSTLPAIGTGIAGLLTGALLTANFSKQKKFGYLLVGGVAGILLGLLWSPTFPINKALWTSSYVLYAAGIGLVLLALLYFVIDYKEIKNWIVPFLVFGVNPMVVFFFSGIIPRALSAIKVVNPARPTSGGPANDSIGLQNYLYNFQIAPHFSDPMAASLAGALIYLVIWFVILYVFYRRKMIFKV
ncbi:acyltransferase family protein [Persicitalea sp.]|uniref:acyltransferase family protein n=1 Tax=Persicitalea sp. TaxID=3100273 RepID=UPI0035941304